MFTKKTNDAGLQVNELVFFIHESYCIHCSQNMRVLHVVLPYKFSTIIFCHQHSNTDINPNYVRIGPVRHWVKCIHKSVVSPCLGGMIFSQIVQHSKGFIRQEWYGTRSSTRNDASINLALDRGASPCFIAVRSIGS